jgi:3-oxoacyl-[acyl-carrier-protein] synthase II
MVTCLGAGVRANWDALKAGRSGIGPITLFDPTGFKSRIAGEVRGDFDPKGYIRPKEFRRLDRFQQFTVVAAGEAVDDAAVTFPPADPYRWGVVIGSGMGGLGALEDGMDVLRAKGPNAAHPLLLTKVIINVAPGLVAIRYGLKGPNFGVVNACTSGTSAIGESFRLIREGRADLVITGGAEAVVTEMSVSAFSRLRALTTRNDEPEKASRPFDNDRDGFVISEGAAILVLESEEHARGRDAKIYCRIAGYGATDDACHVVMPDSDGEAAYMAMKLAAEDAGIAPGEIDYINAHGTSTPLNDRMETRAIKMLLGSSAYDTAISSTKSMTGHMIGAAGAAEAIYSILAMGEGIVPPTINLDKADPECDLDYTPNHAVSRSIGCALSNSFAFGGQNAGLVMMRG